MDNTDIVSIASTTPGFIGNKQKSITSKYKSIGSELTSELLPFKGVMLKQLKRRGYNTMQLPFKTVVALYFNEFVSNKNDSKNHYEPINCFEFTNNPIFKFSVNDKVNGDILNYKNRDYFVQVANVTDRIIDTFRNSKLKKQAAQLQGVNHLEALTDEENQQANAALKVEKDLETKLFYNKPITIKHLFFTVVIIYFLMYLFD